MQRRHRKVPTLWLMTDERIDEATLLSAVARLPKGKAGIVFRHYRTAAAERRALFERICGIARRRRLTLLLAGPPPMARCWGADGWHGRGNGRGASLFRSAPVHDAQEMAAAMKARADMVFLSPLFATRSHPGGRTLGRAGFAALARRSSVPVIALGGLCARHRRMLSGIGAAGWAAIDGLTG